MADHWFARYAALCGENGYMDPPVQIYRSLLALIDRPGKIIELGCGNGLLLRYLCDHSAHDLLPFGIDASPEKIRRAQTEIFPDRPQAFQVGDARRCDWRQAPFAVVITNPIYADRGYAEQVNGKLQRFYADGSVGRYVRECYEHLAPNGLLVLFCYRNQLQEIRADRAAFERELSVVDLTPRAPGTQKIAVFTAEKPGREPTEDAGS